MTTEYKKINLDRNGAMPTKIFQVYIKSHAEAPDYENEVEATTKLEAARKLQKDGLHEWDVETIMKHMDDGEIGHKQI